MNIWPSIVIASVDFNHWIFSGSVAIKALPLGCRNHGGQSIIMVAAFFSARFARFSSFRFLRSSLLSLGGVSGPLVCVPVFSCLLDSDCDGGNDSFCGEPCLGVSCICD